MVVQTGGLCTIVNTGPKRINNGDSVYIEWPNKHTPFENPKARRGSERMLLWTMPYEPVLDAVTKESLNDLVSDCSELDEYEVERRGPILESACILRQALLQAALEAVSVFIDTGLVTINTEALGLDNPGYERRLDASRRNKRGEHRTHFLKTISKALELTNASDDVLSELKVPLPHGPGHKVPKGSLRDYLLKTLMGTDETFHLLPKMEGTHEMPGGIEGDILQRQMSLIDDFFQGVNKGTEFVKSRIICKAITPANPGEEMDVIAGRY